MDTLSQAKDLVVLYRLHGGRRNRLRIHAVAEVGILLNNLILHANLHAFAPNGSVRSHVPNSNADTHVIDKTHRRPAVSQRIFSESHGKTHNIQTRTNWLVRGSLVNPLVSDYMKSLLSAIFNSSLMVENIILPKNLSRCASVFCRGQAAAPSIIHSSNWASSISGVSSSSLFSSIR